MVHEGITDADDHSFTIKQPRSQCTALGEHAEEFVHRTGGTARTQQFSFNTPYGAPADAACGRIAYSGFHVSAADLSVDRQPYKNAQFPGHCTGDLADQEKVLLYMLFDLGACVGAPPIAPMCVPDSCDDGCGFLNDGCGNVIDCGACPVK
jgi:hypothetical protein